MKFTTKTEYGLVCLIYMSREDGHPHWITVKDIVKNEKFSATYMEKILQKLKTAGIVQSQQGKDGGYGLARNPSSITLKEIIEALEGQTFKVYCEPDIRKEIICTHFGRCGVMPIWRKTKELLDNYYASLTLENIAKGEFEEPQVVKA